MLGLFTRKRPHTMKLKMKRTGVFTVNPHAEAVHHCGVPRNFDLHYIVEIETSDDHLDQNGFIIDNNEVHQYFAQTYRYISVFKSCELIAMEACEHFCRRVKGLDAITVSVSGRPGAAWLTSSWSR